MSKRTPLFFVLVLFLVALALPLAGLPQVRAPFNSIAITTALSGAGVGSGDTGVRIFTIGTVNGGPPSFGDYFLCPSGEIGDGRSCAFHFYSSIDSTTDISTTVYYYVEPFAPDGTPFSHFTQSGSGLGTLVPTGDHFCYYGGPPETCTDYSAVAAGSGPDTASVVLVFAAPTTVSVTVTSSPATGNGYITVDSVSQTTPYTTTWNIGDTHTIAAQSPVSCGSGCEYVWTSWSDGGTQSHTYTVPSSSATVTANFQQLFTLTVSDNPSNGGHTDHDGSNPFASGTQVAVTATANSGYSFTGWTLDGSPAGSANPISVTMSGDHTLVADYQLNSVEVTVTSSPVGSGFVTVDGSPITTPQAFNWTAGSNHTLTAHNVGQYAFVGWSDGSEVNPRTITVPSAPTTYAAYYVAPGPGSVNVTVSSSPAGPGLVWVDGNPITTPQTFSWSVGSNHTLAASPLNGSYFFQSWSDGGLQSHVITVPSSATTYTATFQLLCALTVSDSPSAGGSTNYDGTHAFGQGRVVFVTATPNAGYYFVGWTLDGSPDGSSNSVSVTMNSNHTLAAEFQAQPEQMGCDHTAAFGDVAITNATTWNRVCYSFHTLVVAGGSLTVTNSRLTAPQTPAGPGIALNMGTLSLSDTQISPLAVSDNFGSSFTASNVTVTGSIFIGLTSGSISISGFDKSAFSGSWSGTEWGLPSGRLTISDTTVGGVELIVGAGSGTITNSDFDTITVSGGSYSLSDVMTEGFGPPACGGVCVGGSGSVSINGGRISDLALATSDSLTVSGFTDSLLSGSYDFNSEWGLVSQHLSVSGGASIGFFNLYMVGGTSSFSSDTFGAPDEFAVCMNPQSSTVPSCGANVHITNSRLYTISVEGGTVAIDSTTIGPGPSGFAAGSTSAHSSTLQNLDFNPLTPDALTISGFDPVADGGNFDYGRWGFSGIGLVTSNCSVSTVSLDFLHGGSLRATNAKTHFFQGSGTFTNSTIDTAAIYSGERLNLLNTPVGDKMVSGDGAIRTFWWVWISAHDAATGQPLNGVAVQVTGAGGNSTNVTFNGHAQTTFQESTQTAAGTANVYPYSLTASASGYSSATQAIPHFSNQVISFALTPTTPPPQSHQVTFYVVPASAGQIAAGGLTYSSGQSAGLMAGTYAVATSAASGYIFQFWSTTGGVSVFSVTSASTVMTVTADGTLTAVFTQSAPPQAFNFTISLSPPNGTTASGGSVSSQVAVSLIGGTSQTVTLSASSLPTGLAASFSPQSGGPTFGSTMIVTVSGSIQPGTYAFVVTGTGGGISKDAVFSLKVSQPSVSATSGPITLTIAPPHQFVAPGGTVTYTAVVSSSTPAQIMLSGPSDLQGWGASLTPQQGTANPQFVSTITVTVPVAASAGVTELSISASDGSHTATVQVIIEVGGGRTASTAMYTLSVSVQPSGYASYATVSLSPVATSYPAGSSVTATASLTKPLVIDHWVLDDVPAGSTNPLVVTMDSNHSLVLYLTAGSPCVIATATYGSELAPEVQLLRNFRDQQLMKTYAGYNFMVLFNAWYYSFSPGVARYESTNPTMQVAMRVVLYPAIRTLAAAEVVFRFASPIPESAAALSGMVASILLGAFYLGLPLGLVRAMLGRVGGRRQRRLLVVLCAALLSGLVLLAVGELALSPLIVMAASAAVIMSGMFLSAAVTSAVAARKLLSLSEVLRR